MRYGEWSIRSEELDSTRRFSRDALFTVGNGYFGVRGFFEEDAIHPIGKLGGIYMAGVFGAGVQEVCTGPSRELCNLPNLLRLRLTADGEAVCPQEGQPFSQELDMASGVYTRSYEWSGGDGPALRLTFARFARLDHVEELRQQVTITALRDMELSLTASMDGAVTNLNEVSSEPLPVQPGRNHITDWTVIPGGVRVTLDGEDSTVLSCAQSTRLLLNGCEQQSATVSAERELGETWSLALKAGDTVVLEKAVRVRMAEETGMPEDEDYASALAAHSQAWAERWRTADICLDGPVRDRAALRYDLFELMAACPLHTDRVSIGARGLSGEMYEGCVFWDNEIFQLPFFQWSDPASARRLLGFRLHTLKAARERAEELWFQGALYPWQVSEKGREQTVREVGAFYAIHITADVAHALTEYIRISGDEDILLEGGAELLAETARFWVSRSDRDGDGTYHIKAVRGPNEYDVYVDDNAYTNTLAARNLRAAAELPERLAERWPEEGRKLAERLGLTPEECAHMREVADGLLIPYDEAQDLILEDSRYLLRRPMDLRRAKPTGKRIIDSTLPYEALPLYQITKQADVVLLMSLLPQYYTQAQKEKAYDFYEPRTAHDSSLSYAPHGWLAARLGRSEEAYRYFEKSALLDVEDRQLNTISGLHYANFGGTWQMVFRGFLGIEGEEKGISVSPKLPEQWTGFALRLRWRGAVLAVSLEKGVLRCEAEDMGGHEQIEAVLAGKAFVLTAAAPAAQREVEA